MSPPPILIVGGGIGGLTLAALLHRRGIDCLVIERAPQFAPVGAGLVLQANAVKALRVAGLDQAILSRGAAMERLQIRDDRGRILSSIEGSTFVRAFGAGALGFHRATLHAALLEQVPAASIRLDSMVRSFTSNVDGVVVELESGEGIPGLALVGADGMKSAIRRQMVNDGEPRYAGYTSWRGVASRGSLWPSGQMSESWGRGARFGLVAVDGDRLYWFATANEVKGGRDASKADLLKRFSGWHDPIAAAIEATSKDAILRTDISDRKPISRWSEGRVTLLGDAAHPMTPNLGQGGGQAIEDAVVLDRCLAGDHDVAPAFTNYEARRIPRTTTVVHEASRFGRIGQIENGAVRAVRDFALRKTPLSVTLRSVRWLYDYEL